MGVIINYEKHQYNAELSEGDTITIYINDNPTPITYTVNIGYNATVNFTYKESKT
jgi:hypothetical protein